MAFFPWDCGHSWEWYIVPTHQPHFSTIWSTSQHECCAHVVASTETFRITCWWHQFQILSCSPSYLLLHLLKNHLSDLAWIHDTIREGDGEQNVRYWKLLLIIFRASSHHNYATKEVAIFLLQNFSERQKNQLIWSWCINTRGHRNSNIPCDLHMEHLNMWLKTMIYNIDI